MKSITAIILAIILVFSFAFNAHAQTSEVIWLTADTTSFKTGEIVTVLVNAVSVTSIQGFTFQIRYDPACLKPVNAASPIPGMNGLGLPQTAGLVDASFASTVPQTANGVLAEVRFETLGGCQTNLVLESAALAIRDASGFAAPLPGVKLGESNIALAIDSASGNPSPQVLPGTPLPLDPSSPSSPSPKIPVWLIAVITVLLIGALGFGINKVVQKM
ncbi:MAG TPA: cohesin domain-containing protein [Anaerolineales bacterium]|nr:cohesin domain-containing protein [Anaerolineales bacterium]